MGDAEMSDWELFGLVCAAGAVGGLANAVMTDKGFKLPSIAKIDGESALRLGFIGAAFLGAVAAGLSWALYGPLSDAAIAGGDAPSTEAGLTWGALAGALLVGVAGGRWISAEVDKRLFQRAAVASAAADADPERAARMASAPAVEALELAQEMTQQSTA